MHKEFTLKKEKMKAKKNQNGKYTLYDVQGRDVYALKEELEKIIRVAEEAGLVIKGTWPGEEVLEMFRQIELDV